MGPIGWSTPMDGAFGIFLEGGGTYGWKPQVRGGKQKGELDFRIIVVRGKK
jgi:hypothetical protein